MLQNVEKFMQGRGDGEYFIKTLYLVIVKGTRAYYSPYLLSVLVFL